MRRIDGRQGGWWQGVDCHVFTGSVQFIRAVEEHSLSPVTRLMVRVTRSSMSPLRGLGRVQVTTLETGAGDVDTCGGRGW